MTQENNWTFFSSLDVGDVFTINQTPGKFIKIKDTFLKFDEPEAAEGEMPNAFHIDFENYCWISATIICHRVESPEPYHKPEQLDQRLKQIDEIAGLAQS